MKSQINKDKVLASKPQDQNSRLAEFIRGNPQQIITEWVAFARTITPASNGMTRLQLEDHIKELLNFMADDLESAQSDREQFAKSKGDGPENHSLCESAAELHAALRLMDGFDLDQMVSEYRALRASVIKLWTASKDILNHSDVEELTRFNEAVDQAMAESVCYYTAAINESRNMFLGILGHDLRTPLGAALMSAKLLRKLGSLNEKQEILATQIINCNARASQIVSDLLELTREGFGAELPLKKTEFDLGVLGKELVEELQVYSSRNITLELSGELKGVWDASKMGQVFSNLIGNAVQYSLPESTISVSLKGTTETAILEVHNMGSPISANKIPRIFDPLNRGSSKEHQDYQESLGLGLYITKRIVDGHNGTIDVVSNETHGTSFIVTLPLVTHQDIAPG